MTTNFSFSFCRYILFCICLIVSLSAHALGGGTPSDHTQFPGLVFLSFDEVPGTFSTINNCTGIVLEPRRILTAAYCVTATKSTSPFGTVLIPASKIHVHKVIDGIAPLLLGGPGNSPNTRVSNYKVHPNNTFFLGPYNLAVLNLESNINLPVATLYNGKSDFIGFRGTALGWTNTGFINGPITIIKSVLNQLTFPIVASSTDFNSSCYDDISTTGTVFCGGSRNNTNYLGFNDEGAPIYRKINNRNVVIGLLTNASGGLLYDNGYHYEEFSRISSMVNFIKQHAPNTQFWNESSVGPELKINILPMLHLLLLSKE